MELNFIFNWFQLDSPSLRPVEDSPEYSQLKSLEASCDFVIFIDTEHLINDSGCVKLLVALGNEKNISHRFGLGVKLQRITFLFLSCNQSVGT